MSKVRENFKLRMRVKIKGTVEEFSARVVAVAKARAPILTGALHDSFFTTITPIDDTRSEIVLHCKRYARYVGVFGAAFKPILLGGADPAVITRQSGKGRKRKRKGKRGRKKTKSGRYMTLKARAKRPRGRPKTKKVRGRPKKPRPRGRPRKKGSTRKKRA